jgi:hypothetical protein
MVETRNSYKIFVGEPEGRDHSEDPDEEGRISEWILGKEGGKV